MQRKEAEVNQKGKQLISDGTGEGEKGSVSKCDGEMNKGSVALLCNCAQRCLLESLVSRCCQSNLSK
jgi:hypothetical protein